MFDFCGEVQTSAQHRPTNRSRSSGSHFATWRVETQHFLDTVSPFIGERYCLWKNCPSGSENCQRSRDKTTTKCKSCQETQGLVSAFSRGHQENQALDRPRRSTKAEVHGTINRSLPANGESHCQWRFGSCLPEKANCSEVDQCAEGTKKSSR